MRSLLMYLQPFPLLDPTPHLICVANSHHLNSCLTPRSTSDVVVAHMDSSVVMAPLTIVENSCITRPMVLVLPILGPLHMVTPGLGPIIRFVSK